MPLYLLLQAVGGSCVRVSYWGLPTIVRPCESHFTAPGETLLLAAPLLQAASIGVSSKTVLV